MRLRSSGLPQGQSRKKRTPGCWRGSSAAATRDSKRVIEPAEHRRLVAATADKADVDVAHDEGTRDPAHSESSRNVQVREGTLAHGCKDLAGVDEGRELEAHVRAE